MFIIISIIDFLSILLERNYYKYKIESSKMKQLKNELIDKHSYSSRKINEIEKEIQYITNDNFSFYLKDKFIGDFFLKKAIN
jgi:hypothetical protein